MSVVQVRNGHLVVPDKGALRLGEIGDALLTAVLMADIDEPGHISKLFSRLSAVDRARFEVVALGHYDPNIRFRYANAALDWASVGSSTGKWDLAEMRPVYREPIGSWLLKDVVATESGRWYGVTDEGEVLSSAELEFRYGFTIAEHLKRFLDFEAIRIGRTIEAMRHPFVERRIQVQVADGLLIVSRHGPANIPTKDWLLKPGETFVGDAE